MITELLRPLLRVLFWNRWRPIAAAAMCIVVIAVIARAVSGGSHGHPGGGHPRPAATAARASTHATTPGPAAVTGGPPPAAAVTAGQRFMTAWVTQGPGWAARIRPYVTARLAAQLGTSNAGNPATAVTGTPAVTSQSAGTVSFSVPTNAGPVLVTVQDTGGRWLADSVQLARTGD